MLEIYVNNQLAALKEDAGFDFVNENRLFAGSDGYTLSVVFPLAGCDVNRAIFGYINRRDVLLSKAVYDCEIRCRGFHRYGCFTVTAVDDVEVKGQFLEGRSESNFRSPLSKVYVNELNLGVPDELWASAVAPVNAWNPHWQGGRAVALPWVSEGSGVTQNNAMYRGTSADGDGEWVWRTGVSRLSWQPYLVEVVRAVARAIGYTMDMSAMMADRSVRWLLVCNALPAGWSMPGYATALPHWTVEEFFAKLGLFLGWEFELDHKGREVRYSRLSEVLPSLPAVVLRDVLEEYSSDITAEEAKCDYPGACNIVYKDVSADGWKYMSCHWLFAKDVTIVNSEGLQQLLDSYREEYRLWDGVAGDGRFVDYIFYAADVDAHFVVEPLRKRGDKWECRLAPVNLFGGRIVDSSKEAATKEIEFVPVVVDTAQTSADRIIVLSPSGDEQGSDFDADAPVPAALRRLRAGNSEKGTEFYDRIYVGWWDGTMGVEGEMPRPAVAPFEVADDWSGFSVNPDVKLRLNAASASERFPYHSVDPSQKTTFKWLANSMPDVRSVFIIDGKQYVCEKITATVTTRGMSQLLKGEFYPIAD